MTSILGIRILKVRQVSGNYSLGKKVNKDIVSADDLKQYKSILNLTSAHLEGYEPSVPNTSPAESNSEP